MKRKIFVLFVFLFVLSFTSCKKPDDNNDDLPVFANPTITLNKDHYVIGDEIIFNIFNYDDLSLFNVSFDTKHAVKIENGKYFANRAGEYTATFTLKEDSSYTTTVTFTTYAKLFTLDVTTETMAVGDKIETWIFNFDNLFEQSDDDFTFTVSDESKASIEGRVLTAKEAGTVDIIATSKYHSGVTAKKTITIGNDNDTFMIKPPFELGTLKAGDQFYMDLSLDYNADDFVWSTNNSEVIRVVVLDNKCQITIVGKGKGAVICYNQDNPAINSKYTVNITETAEIDYVGRFLDLAYEQVGIVEDGPNGQKFGEWYKNPNQPWCAQFVSWCWYHAGLSNELLLKYQSCYMGMKWCSEQGIMHYVQDYTFPSNETMENGIYTYKKEDYTPKAGDIIFFLSNGAGHTGIVAHCDGEYIYTIEGNRSNRVGVWRIKLTNTTITGYASPDYPDCSNQKDYSWIAEKQANGSYLWTDVSSGDSTQ